MLTHCALQNIRRPAKGQRKRIRKQSDAGGEEGGAGGRKDAEARMREDLFGADNAGASLTQILIVGVNLNLTMAINLALTLGPNAAPAATASCLALRPSANTLALTLLVHTPKLYP